ncbi:MAG: AFG1 family ATPase [Betaproteobacteria bacterium]|nr:MAG: AFG1 family ATPase [Betaproteobacteria bacterium]
MSFAAYRSEAQQDSFLDHAQRAAQRHNYQLDDAQLRASKELDRLYQQLIEAQRGAGLLRRLFRREPQLRGIYFWGGVGRGKTFLMDVFYESVPFQSKQRLHFHRFMQGVHYRLRDLQGQASPLRVVGHELAEQSTLLCLDEFHVTDIGDAMIMRLLLESLFERGVVLVTTANWHPESLYEHGLQRAQFLPAIDLIMQHMSVVNIDSGTDYRLASLEKAGVFHPTTDTRAEEAMLKTFCDVSGEPGGSAYAIEIEGREIGTRRLSQGVVWFDFLDICGGPRGKNDYIEVSKRYHTVLISNVPPFTRINDNERRRFTWLVDEFYDRRVKLVISAQGDWDAIFAEALGGTETDRTHSRLIEMQTRSYLCEPHLP